jgi:proteasome accessory factor A
MRAILAGIDCEYGLLIQGRGAEDQIEDATEFVRAYPGKHFAGWNYRYESPRADLRGFQLERLAVDPEDAKFDEGRIHAAPRDVRSDRVLPNGARFYNDHGHPEYASPECLSLDELARQDRAGMLALLRTKRAFEETNDLATSVYRNNTDFHGASYGTHESYLVPRAVGVQALAQALIPMLICRTVLTGAGKVGSETGPAATYQLSQRADFFVEPMNAETLFRRPIFNTRDEAHSDPGRWIRLHVISGDSNMILDATKRKAGLVKLAIALAESGHAPVWKIRDPVQAFQKLSRDNSLDFRLELEGNSWTNAYEVLESYFAAAEAVLETDRDICWTISSSRVLLKAVRDDPETFRRHVDWAAKRWILESAIAESGTSWRDPALRSYDLEYHNIDPDEGLYWALESMGEVEAAPSLPALAEYLSGVNDPTRAVARGIAVSKFLPHVRSICWRTLTLEFEGKQHELELPPDAAYPPELLSVPDVGTFIERLRELK